MAIKHHPIKYIAFALVFCLALFFVCPTITAHATAPWVPTSAYTVIDADTGQILFGQNADKTYDPASITKVLTLGLACEKAKGDWSTKLTVSEEDVTSIYSTGSSHISLVPGEVLTLEQALYAVLRVSANDAANTLASYIGGDISGGVAAMNAKVAELGLQNAHFINPHGLDDPAHQVSPNDMAQILAWALKQDGFYELFTDREIYTMPPTNKQVDTRYFSMDDSVRLGSSKYYVPEVVGAKTGYTDLSRYTYIALAEKSNVRLICVTMHSQEKPDRYKDVKTILNYAFANFKRVEIPAFNDVHEFDIVGGGDILGMGTATDTGTSFLLYNGEGADTISVEYTLPSKYVLGQTYIAEAIYTLPENANQVSSSISSPLKVSDFNGLIKANIGVTLPTSSDLKATYQTKSIFFPTLIVTSLILFIFFIYVQIKLNLRAKKRKKKKIINQKIY